MKISDALSILGLSSGASQDEIKSAYKGAAKKYHPDLNPAGAEMMKLVNAAFDVLRDATSTQTQEGSDCNYGEELNAAINAIIDLDGLEIEICGAWVWVGGNTREHKETLKQAGFKYAKKKQKWNYRPSGWKSRSRGTYSMDDIRDAHGSTRPSRPSRRNYALGAAA
ncbi:MULTISPECIES: DnaJ domain-containing protein [unclassified Pseudovibrio]|uniref:J domain-containing protein n=1 Tax=unclassified Pseudovibrio TaxID=2627060 RepID=UPI0007AE561F|nr:MULTISPECIES: DnaJ domain-containing protein [unclassified Pseudovibrio]KZK95248.1 Chaperone protein DnaJ [Pseudovibrio sp. W74]KZL10426.1 Chaperone protein DnaJ [Pseudovibrio sp. Ad14]KZL16543.1 Chaperone protein DnaJ [Pseudovibrio sp. Ad26]